MAPNNNNLRMKASAVNRTFTLMGPRFDDFSVGLEKADAFSLEASMISFKAKIKKDSIGQLKFMHCFVTNRSTVDVTRVLDPYHMMSIRRALGSHEKRVKYSYMCGERLHSICLDNTSLVASCKEKLWEGHTLKTKYSLSTGLIGVQWHIDLGNKTFKTSLDMTGGHAKLTGKCTWFFF